MASESKSGAGKRVRFIQLHLAPDAGRAEAQHVVQRGHNRQACFFEAVYTTRTIGRPCARRRWYVSHVHAHVLMTNQVHLLLTPPMPVS